MDLRTFANQTSAFFDDGDDSPHGIRSPVPGLLLLRHVEPTPMKATLYEPVVCLILQGCKETVVGEYAVSLGPGDSMVVSHDLPVVSRITQAEPGTPYLAVIVMLDMAMMRGLYSEIGDEHGDDGEGRSLAAHPADDHLIDALSRYLALAHDPIEARVLLPLVKKEVHFRLLTAPHGGMLRRLLRHDSHASTIARAIAHIRTHFRTNITIPELARAVGMSPSLLHKHFKHVTATTPLQYQKELRLLEAQRLLSGGQHSVSTVAYDVGYGSPNQFSREYARKFGASPRSHIPARAAR